MTKGQYPRSKGKIELNKVGDYINGLLLSDGHINKSGKKASRFQQTCKEKGWLEEIQSFFLSNNIKCKISNKYYNSTFFKVAFTSESYLLWTLSYQDFKILREKWYPEGKKTVPDDIKLTPECVGNWYLGDGSLNRVHGQIMLYTMGFSRENVDFLSETLNQTLDIISKVDKNRNISIPNRNSITFVDYIKKSWISCYNYKFNCVRKKNISK